MRSTMEVRQLSFCGFDAARCSSCAATSTGAAAEADDDDEDEGDGDGDGDGDDDDAGGAVAAGLPCEVDVGAAPALPIPSFERIVPNTDMDALLANDGMARCAGLTS